MSNPIQCDNCGATILDGETFCGECGAPSPSVDAPVGEAEAPQPAPLPLDPPAAQPRRLSDRDTIWRVSAAVLGAVGALLCLLGIAAGLLFGLTEAEGMTQAENWLYSVVCCLLPIAGAGTVLAIAALVIWWAKLRNR